MNNNDIYLEVNLPFGRSLNWFHNARDARAELLDTAKRMRCWIKGTGHAGQLISFSNDTVKADYKIGTETS